jgi:hypothetical protein
MNLKPITNRMLLFFIFFLLTAILCFGSGYITKMNDIKKQSGMEFLCLSNYKQDGTSCNATLTFPETNTTMLIKSNFDNLKVLNNE